MSDRVQVESIDALTQLRVGIIKFSETCKISLSDVEADFQHMLNWLENEQLSYWQRQIRVRNDALSKAKEAMRSKRVFKDSAGRTPQAVDEEKAVRIAQVRIAEAEEKLANVRKYIRVMQKEIQNYKGSIQRFVTTIESDIPLAVATLDRMMQSLEAYVALAPGESAAATPESISIEPPPAVEAPPPKQE